MMTTIIAILALLLTSSAWAAPSITGWSGTIADGQNITVIGTGFGATGPNILVFDDFSNCSGEGADTSATATVGTWTAFGGYKPTCTTVLKTRGYGVQMYNPSVGAMRQFKKTFPTKVTEVFMSYWAGIPNGTTFPYATTEETFPNASVWKMTWLMNQSTSNPGATLQDNDLCVPTHVSQKRVIVQGNALKPSPVPTILGSADTWWQWDVLNHISVWLKADESAPATNNGTIWYHAAGNGTKTETIASPIFATGAAPYQWGQINIPGLIKTGSSTTRPVMDDIYVATGPGAAARVELGNQPVYANCTNLAILTPTSWSNTSVTATVRQGSFTAGSQAYLYVFDANNTPSAAPLAVTIGGAGEGTPAVNGVCDPASNGGFFFSEPTALCTTGIPYAPVLNGSLYTWTCGGTDGGTTASCSAFYNPPSQSGGASATAVMQCDFK